MTFGTSIFLSTMIISIVVLFVFTKDNWKWKKITLIVSSVMFFLGLIIGLLMWYLSYTHDKPQKMTKFQDIALAMSRDDVKFIKGKPQLTEDNGTYWGYQKQGDSNLIVVTFNGNKVVKVTFTNLNGEVKECFKHSYLTQDSDSIIKYYGEPSSVDTSDEGLSRRYNYDKLNIYFKLSQNKVYSCGIYDAKTESRKPSDLPPLPKGFVIDNGIYDAKTESRKHLIKNKEEN